MLLGFACDEGGCAATRGGSAPPVHRWRCASCWPTPPGTWAALSMTAGTCAARTAISTPPTAVWPSGSPRALDLGHFPLVLGGGHEVAFGSWSGLNRHLAGKGRVGIINFDAHFDLRMKQEQASSGTPFFQIAEQCAAQGTPFHYACLGVAETANTGKRSLPAPRRWESGTCWTRR